MGGPPFVAVTSHGKSQDGNGKRAGRSRGTLSPNSIPASAPLATETTNVFLQRTALSPPPWAKSTATGLVRELIFV